MKYEQDIAIAEAEAKAITNGDFKHAPDGTYVCSVSRVGKTDPADPNDPDTRLYVTCSDWDDPGIKSDWCSDKD